MKTRTRLALGCGLLMATLTCSGGDATDPVGQRPTPVPGWLNVVLSAPDGDLGGLLFTVAGSSGASVDSVRTSSPYLFTKKESSQSWEVIVAGTVRSGTVAQIWVPNTVDVAKYSATVAQAAAATTFAQQDVAAYRLQVGR